MRYYTIFFLILLSLIYISIDRDVLPTYQILGVKTADKYYIDYNRNGKIEENELTKVVGIYAFKPFPARHFRYSSRYVRGWMPYEVMSLGVLAEEFAKQEFVGQFVKVKKLYKGYARLYLGDKDVATILLNEGFGVPDKVSADYMEKEFSIFEFLKKVKNLTSEDILVLNKAKNKYHLPTCDYYGNYFNLKAIRKKDLPDDYSGCQVCVRRYYDKPTKVKNFDFTSGVLSFYFTDFNKSKLPDNSCKINACRSLLNQINNAKSSIDFAMYGIANQPLIVDALVNAKKRGVKIRWVTDMDNKNRNIYRDVSNVQKLLPNYKTDNISYENFKYKNALMHNKFFIFDNKTLWLGTANLSSTDLADFNSNIVVLANSSVLAQIYKKEFEQMYSGKFRCYKSEIKNKENLQIDPKNKVSIYFSPTDKIISTKLIPLINNARDYVYISAFTITNKQLKEALIKARNRGVDIKIIIDATSAGGNYSIHESLRSQGILVKVENKAGKMHSKSMLIDDKHIIVGSMNFTKSGEYYNDENVMHIVNSEAIEIFRNQFLYLWKSIPNKWLTNNPPAESPYSINSCFDGIDNDFDGLVDKADYGCFSVKK